MNNSTSNIEVCQNIAMVFVGQWLSSISYTVLLPIYLIVGLTGNIILLVAFYKHSKTEQTYVYQVLLTVSKTLEIIVFGGFQFTTRWLPDWLEKSYVLTFLFSKLGMTGHMHFIMSSLLFSVAMAADRVFALTFPFRYRNIKHFRHQLVAAIVCFVLPAISSLSYSWLTNIVAVGGGYTSTFNAEAAHSTIFKASVTFGILLRIIAVIALIILNIIMIIAFSKRTKKAAEMQKKDEAARLADKTLLRLNICQSVLMFINQFPHIVLHSLLVFFTFALNMCSDMIASPVADGCIFITDSVDLLIILAINKKIRGIVANAFRWRSNNQVAT